MSIVPKYNEQDSGLKWTNLMNHVRESIKLSIAGNTFNAAHELQAWETWREWVHQNGAGPAGGVQYRSLRGHLWAAEVLSRRPDSIDGLSHHFDAVTEKPSDLEPIYADMSDGELQAWLFDCVREVAGDRVRANTFRPPSEVEPKGEVPVALCEEIGLGEGVVVLFSLELFAGSGNVFQHPADGLRYAADSVLVRSVRNAWEAAKRFTKAPVCDGRWSLCLPDSVAEVKGPSAGAAAARCMWYALAGKEADAGVLVMAAVNKAGTVNGVDGIRSKTQAVARRAPNIDTIVVADSDAAKVARQTLEAEHAAGRVRVVDLTEFALHHTQS